MGNDGPDGGYWVTPGQPAPEPPAFGSPPTGGWSALPPPPPGGGWSSGPPPPYGWGQYAPPQPPRPGVIPLRPLGVGELLDGAFTTIRRYPGATLGMAAPIMFVVELVRVMTTYYLLHGVNTSVTDNLNGTVANHNSDLVARTSTLEIAVLVVTFVATALLSGLIAAVVGEGALGRPMNANQAWRAARGSFWRLLGATVLIFVILIVIVIAGIVPGLIIAIVGPHGVGIALAVFGGLASVFAVTYLSTLLVFTSPVLVLEKQGILAAMSRSRTLVRGSWWRVFGIVALAGIISSVVAGVIGAPFALAGGSLGNIFSGQANNEFSFHAVLLSGIGGLIGAVLVRPFAAAVIALLYVDRRMRAEALDLTLQQAAANPTP